MVKYSLGDTLPEFDAVTSHNEKISSRDYLGQPLWLGIYRYASCPLCNLRIHEIIQRWPAYAAKGLQKLAVFQSDADTMAHYVGNQQPPFALIADPEEKIYALFGAAHSWAGFVHPANAAPLARATRAGFLPGKMQGTKSRLPMDLLIDKDGTIVDIFAAKFIGDHIPFDRVEAFLDTQ